MKECFLIIYILIVAGIFLLDLYVKNRIERTEKEGETRKILGGRLLLRRHHNRGLALNKGSGLQPLVAAISLGLTVLCTVLFILSLGKRGNLLLHTGLALLLGGAYSNTYDRLKRKFVVDYVSFPVKWKRFSDIIFNISDFCILVGALLLFVSKGSIR